MMVVRRWAVTAAVAGLLGLGSVLPAIAQDSGTMSAPPPAASSGDSQRQLDLAAARAQRKAIIGANMNLTEAEATKFWPVYDQYQTKMDQLDMRQANEIKDFARNYSTLTNEQATKKLNEVMDILQARLAVEKSFIPKYRAVMSPIKVTRFYQIDHKLRALIQCQIAQAVPLAKAPGAANQ